MSQLNNDVEPKSTSKESSYLDKNKINNDNRSDEMNQLGWVKRNVRGKISLFRCKRE
jgi:hypothetical protein